MDHRIATLNRRTQRLRLRKIANNRLAANAFKILQIACFAYQKPEIGSFSGQRSRHMMAHKSGCACQKDFHSLESLTPF